MYLTINQTTIQFSLNIATFNFLTRKVGPKKLLWLLLLFFLLLESVLPGPKIPNTQQSATKLCTYIHADIAQRSVVSDFSLIF